MKRWLGIAIVVVAGCPEAPRSAPPANVRPIPRTTEGPASAPPGEDAGVDSGPADATPIDEASVSRVPGLIYLYQVEPGEEAHETCGAYTIDTLVTSYSSRVEVSDDKGRLIRKLTPKTQIESYRPAWCFDVTGDGTPELAVTHSSGGAHCCHTHTLLSLGPQPKTLLEYAAGNGSNELLSPTDLDGKAPWELVDTDDILTGYGSTAYAFTRFLPVVFVFEKGRYVKATRRFTSYLEKERNQALSEVRACAPACWADGEGEYVLGLSLLIGDWDRLKKEEGLAAGALLHLETLRRKIAPHLMR